MNVVAQNAQKAIDNLARLIEAAENARVVNGVIGVEKAIITDVVGSSYIALSHLLQDYQRLLQEVADERENRNIEAFEARTALDKIEGLQQELENLHYLIFLARAGSRGL